MWKASEKNIFRIELDGKIIKLDPVRMILRYSQAVKEKGIEEFKLRWKRYHRKPGTGLEDWHEQDMQDADDCIFIAEIGARTLGMELGTEEGQLTCTQARDALYSYVDYITKKGNGEETSISQDKPVSSPPGETNEATPCIPTS